jgi:two-component system CheB/CheR fusion protein
MPTLSQDVQAVLDTLMPKEVEVQTKAGTWFLMRIRPYRTLENVIEGAVITFTDITEMKGVRAALRESETLRRLAVVVRDARDAITVQDLEGRILAWNPGRRDIRLARAEALAMNIRDLIPEGQRRKHWPCSGNKAALRFWSRTTCNGSQKMAGSWRCR